MSKHTNGPWRTGGGGRFIYDRDGRIIASATRFHDRREIGTVFANARRIVACVNACEGIRTEALEWRGHLLKAADDTIAAMTDQRDKLRTDLESQIQCLMLVRESLANWKPKTQAEMREKTNILQIVDYALSMPTSVDSSTDERDGEQ